MNIATFLGLDLRAGERQPGSLVLADHVRLNDRGSVLRRPGLRRLVDLPAASAGLYGVDDVLRVCAPNGTAITGLSPTVLVDFVDTAAVHGRVQAVRLASGRRALWIEHVGAADGPAGIHITNRLPSAAEGLGVASVTVVAGGVDYDGTDTVVFGDPGPGGIPASGTLVVDDGLITGVTITDPGSGYTAPPTVTVTSGSGYSAVLTAVLVPGTVGSAVALPVAFIAPWGLIGLYGRLWSLDRVSNRLRWSGVDDPDVNDGKGYVAAWDEDQPLDQHGGSVDLGQGSSEPLAIAEYRGRVAVFLRTQVQTWLPGSDGVDSLDQTITGPGTRYPGTVAAVSGDLIYADAGSWIRALSTDGATEGAQEGSGVLGSQVHELTAALITPGGAQAVSLFSRGLSCYLVGSGTTLLCLSLTPGGEVHGWSRWELPVVADIDAIAEVRGLVYLRCGTALYYLEPNALDDEVSTGVNQDFAPVIELAPLPTTASGERGTQPPTVGRLGLVCNGGTTVLPLTDGRPRVASTLAGKAPAPAWRYGAWPAWSFSVRITAADALPAWSLDQLIIE